MTHYNISTATTVRMTTRVEDLATTSSTDTITLDFYRGDDQGVTLELTQAAWQQLRYLLQDTDRRINLIGVPALDGSGDICRDCGGDYPVVDVDGAREIASEGPLGGYQTCLICAAGG